MIKLLIALIRYMARDGVSDADKVNVALHDLGVYVAAMSGQPALLRGFIPRSQLPDLADDIKEGLDELREATDVEKLKTLASDLRRMRDNYSLGIETDVSAQLLEAASEGEEREQIEKREIEHYNLIDRALDVIGGKIEGGVS